MKQERILEKAAMLFYNIGHYRQASLLMAEAVNINNQEAATWCGLGSSLGQLAMGRQSMNQLAVGALKRCLQVMGGGEYHKVAQDWINSLSNKDSTLNLTPPMNETAFNDLFKTLALDSKMFVNAMEHIKADDRMFIIMAIREVNRGHYVPTLLEAVKGKWGDGCARAALKRIVVFKEDPQVLATLTQVAQSPNAEELEPYLSHAINSIKNSGNQGSPQRGGSAQPQNGSGVLDSISNTVEEGIKSLGIQPQNARGAKPYTWEFTRGSAKVSLGIVTSERYPKGYFYVTSLLMDAQKVQAHRRESFYKNLLELNTSLVNMKLTLSKDFVILISNRDAAGLDAEEVASVINELSYNADLLDDKLKAQFV